MSEGKELKPAGVTYPRRLQLDSKGNILVLDGKARKVLKVDTKGAVARRLSSSSRGPRRSRPLPVAFKVDAADNVYVVDAVGARVVVFDPGRHGHAAGRASQGDADHHRRPRGRRRHRLRRRRRPRRPSGRRTRPRTAFKPFTQGMKDKMNFPVYMTGSKGRLFLVDQNGNGIVVLGADGAFQGRQLAIGWGDGYLYYPAQLCINGAGDGVHRRPVEQPGPGLQHRPLSAGGRLSSSRPRRPDRRPTGGSSLPRWWPG